MSGRPPVLFPLFGDIETLPGIGPKTGRALATMGIAAPRDMLFNLPHSGIDRRPVRTVQGANLPGALTVEVEIGAFLSEEERLSLFEDLERTLRR